MIMESSYAYDQRLLQDRVTDYLTHDISCGWCLSGFGFSLLVVIMSVGGNFDSVRTAWLVLVLFSLPSFCLGLFIIITMLCLLLLGIGAIARGMRGVSLIEAVTGLIITTQSSILLVGVFDIALNASDNVGVVLFLPIGVFCGGFIMANLFRIVWAVKMVCLKRWGTILQAKVHHRRRQHHCRIRMDDNGMESDEHQLLVTFEVEASHQHHPFWSWKKYGYQRVFSPTPTTEANSVDHDHEEDLTLTEALLCGESNEDLDCQHQSHILDDGCPFRSRLVQEQEKSDDNNAIPYSRQSIQKWLTVNESQYESSNNFVEVSVLPNWPQISVATDTLPSSCRAAFEVIACMSRVVVGSVFCVFSTRGIFEDDDILWHVKASYIYVLISFLPTLSLPLLFLLGNALLEVGESSSHVPNESSPELPMATIAQSTRGSVAEDDEDELATTTRFREEDTLTLTYHMQS